MPWSAERYRRARARPHSPPGAVRMRGARGRGQGHGEGREGLPQFGVQCYDNNDGFVSIGLTIVCSIRRAVYEILVS